MKQNKTVPTCTDCEDDDYCYQDMSDPSKFRCIKKPKQEPVQMHYISTASDNETKYLRGVTY